MHEHPGFRTISVTVDDAGIARLRLQRPGSANTIDAELAEELHRAAAALRWDPAVRVVVLSGEGKVFCGGGDLAEFAALGDRLPARLTSVTADLHGALLAFAAMDAPLVAAVGGSAGGAGLSLVAGADLVVAARRAKFTMAYTGIALTPDGGASFFLSRAVGLRRAMELVLTNRVLSAEEAQEWGLVNVVVDDDALEAEVESLAARLAAGPTASFGAAKRLFLEGAASDLAAALAREADSISRASTTPDAAEGIAAFLAKRPPSFGEARRAPRPAGGPASTHEVTVFYNDACSKCRSAVELLDGRGVDYGLVEYLVAPPDRATLESMVAKLVDPVADLVRTDDPAFAALGLAPDRFTAPGAVVSLLLEHPEVMQRPVVVKGDRAVIARPPERVDELLGPAS
ncbi:MAG TPA: enoyl-CoA hydratase-related protein [Acidimicrobiales bacterium]|nr:enoyl-CoA hydratase-related protein [Acidimicrobiales bacterium]